MSTPTKDRVLVKIFIGFELTVDIKIQLNQSSEWKQASVVKDETNQNLIEAHYSEHDYLGQYFDFNTLTMKDVTSRAQDIRKRLKEYCPDLDVDALKIHLFPQVFIS